MESRDVHGCGTFSANMGIVLGGWQWGATSPLDQSRKNHQCFLYTDQSKLDHALLIEFRSDTTINNLIADVFLFPTFQVIIEFSFIAHVVSQWACKGY